MGLLSRLAVSSKRSARKEEATRLLNKGDEARHEAVNNSLQAEVIAKAKASGMSQEELNNFLGVGGGLF